MERSTPLMNEAVSAFRDGMSFDAYRQSLRVHREAFNNHYDRLAAVANELRGQAPLADIRVLAISDDWCPDCVFNLPILARMVEASPGAELRIVRRPPYRALAEQYPGRGGTSRIPTFIFLNAADKVIGHWSERCAASQHWFEAFTKEHPLPELHFVDGIPVAPLMDWMRLRIASERTRFYDGVWRDVAAEIAAIVGAPNR
jgi:hypothetical protein